MTQIGLSGMGKIAGMIWSRHFLGDLAGESSRVSSKALWTPKIYGCHTFSVPINQFSVMVASDAKDSQDSLQNW